MWESGPDDMHCFDKFGRQFALQQLHIKQMFGKPTALSSVVWCHLIAWLDCSST
jgi:hypothetical protein